MSGSHGIGCEPVLPRHRRERRRGARPQAVIGGLACSFLILSITGCVAPTSSAQQTTPGSAAPSAAAPTPQATATQVPTPTPAPAASPTPTSGFSLTGSMAVARTRHTATLLQDGRVLIVGGSSKAWSSPSLASAELYDPATGKFVSAQPMNAGRFDHTATLLPDGRVPIVGGYSGSKTGSTLASAEIYQP